MLPEVRKIIDRWYLSEGALFQTFVSHNFEENLSISVPFRSGRGKVEYNSMILSSMRPREVELHLKAEMVRILLKHPYERQPEGCNKKSIAVGSNLVLGDNYDFSEINMPTPEAFDLKEKESFEWYSHRVEEMFSPKEIDLDSMSENPNDDKSSADSANGNEGNEDSGETSDELDPNAPDNAPDNDLEDPSEDVETTSSLGKTKHRDDEQGQLSEKPREDRDLDYEMKEMGLADLWEEDPMMGCSIDSLIDEIEASNEWGSLAGTFARKIVANTNAKVDYRKVLSGFRASILSSKRCLTRMRPNRRTGFDNMGSMRRFDTKLLVAVDVSASIGETSIRHFYSVINRFFKYGMDQIDVIQFDTSLSEVQKMTKKQLEVKVLGFGGTSFQPLFNYLGEHPDYNGVIIFTDGDAPIPNLPPKMKTKVMWVCNSQRHLEVNKSWMQKIGRCCAIDL